MFEYYLYGGSVLVTLFQPNGIGWLETAVAETGITEGYEVGTTPPGGIYPI